MHQDGADGKRKLSNGAKSITCASGDPLRSAAQRFWLTTRGAKRVPPGSPTGHRRPRARQARATRAPSPRRRERRASSETPPAEKRLCASQKPWPSYTRIFTAVHRRFRNTYAAPQNGSTASRSRHSRASPSMPRRKSAGSMATSTRIWGVNWITHRGSRTHAPARAGPAPRCPPAAASTSARRLPSAPAPVRWGRPATAATPAPAR